MTDQPTMPTININGSDATRLMTDYLDAHAIAMQLDEKMHAIQPHGRDYQLAPERYEKARAEFEQHMRNISAARQYLMDIAIGIHDQKER